MSRGRYPPLWTPSFFFKMVLLSSCQVDDVSISTTNYKKYNMANFVVIHLEKAKGADTKMSAHIERTVIAGNVDGSRIHLDRELIAFPEGVKSRSAAIDHRIENVKLKRKVGKNQVHAIRIMLSASPEAMERIEQETTPTNPFANSAIHITISPNLTH